METLMVQCTDIETKSRRATVNVPYKIGEITPEDVGYMSGKVSAL